MTSPIRLLAALLVLLAMLAGSRPALAGQRFTIFYTNDTLGETEPCG